MPAKSKSQQKLAGMALAFKRGSMSRDEIGKAAVAMADSMTVKELEDMASGSMKGKPNKVK